MVEAPVLDQVRTSAAGSETAGRPLRLLVLAPKPVGLSPGQRFRLEQWATRARSVHGITLDFAPFESPALTKILYQPGQIAAKGARVAADFARRAGAVLAARRYDGVIVYREVALIGPAIYERLLAWSGVPMFYDFDDAIWLPGQQISQANGIFSRLHFWGKTSSICRLADAVLVGNSYLADYAGKRNSNVFVLPTSIELDSYPVQPELPTDDPFVVCWTGSNSTLPHFEQARRPLERLAALRPVIVKIICNRAPDRPIAGAENVFVPWTQEGEAAHVGASHVGIMPLPDNDYTRGKCGLKALQYMATGRPVVIAPVGMNVDLVRSGENGFLASSDDEWVAALTRLADGRELRTRIGMAGRKTVEDHYSAEVVSGLFAHAVRATIGAARDGSTVRSG